MERPLIAIVNTEQSFLELMRELLCDEGYDTLTLTPCQEAFEIIVQRQPRLLLLELRITNPECGWKALRAMRVHPQTAHIPIIIATTAAQLVRDTEARVRLEGCSILLMPFDIEDVLTMVGAIVPAPAMHHVPHLARGACYSSATRPSKRA